ncbi:MAG: phosphate ABC transporter permease subunit PstC [Dehalococcoidales bacterium]|nr:phosphate ABC transporter permease subunit PstC [Dehalococcoidales bacterium]
MKIPHHLTDKFAKYTVLVCAASSVIILAAITVFIVLQGMPTFQKVGVFDFLFGTEWRPTYDKYGILAMIVGSTAVTIGALAQAIPLGIACAILLAEVAPNRIRSFLRPAVELLVGIPSVIYGLIGMVLIVPAVRHIGGSGFSILAACLVLTAMVLPTIISISEDSIRAVPHAYKEGALALGATRWQTISRVLLPSARSGIIASIVLGMGRAVGETMAMIMVIGNAIAFPKSPLDPARTLTGNIAVEINYATGTHESALFATGIVLLIFIIVLNTITTVVLRRGIQKHAEHLT